MSLKDITITSSIKSLATQSYGQRTYVASSDLESFPIESITGSHVGAWPNFEPGTNYTVNLFVNVTQSWSGSNPTVLGVVPYIHNTNDEFFNGEFSGSNFSALTKDGGLTDEDCLQALSIQGIAVSYSLYPYIERYYDGVLQPSSGSLSQFLHRYTAPAQGQILFFVRENWTTDDPMIPLYDVIKRIQYVKIAIIDHNGNNNTSILDGLPYLQWEDSNQGIITLNVLSQTQYSGYYLYSVTSQIWSGTVSGYADSNYLNYTLRATSSAIFSITGSNYYYLTSSWTSSIDIAGGFNTSSGQYTFPLSPNFPITFTASLNITASTTATFSWAINGYDPLFPINVPNAAQSFPTSISTTLGTNTVYLNAGESRSLYITSSTNFPIQNYKYEIDAYIKGDALPPLSYSDDLLLNPELTGIAGTAPGNDYIPYPYVCTVPYLTSSIHYFFNTVKSLYDYWGYSLNASNGGISHDDTAPPPSQSSLPAYQLGRVTFRSDMSSGVGTLFAGSIGDVYKIDIVVPPPTPVYGTFVTDWTIIGPPLLDITCSLLKDNPSNPNYLLGYIPSGAYGTFSFFITKTAANESDLETNGEICLTIPISASDLNAIHTVSNTGSMFVVESITLGTASAATGGTGIGLAELSNLSFSITQSKLPQFGITNSITFPLDDPSADIYSDCYVLINNFSENDTSTSRRRVLYDDGSIIPSNIEQIISGTAEYAEVNDYLFNANASTRPRYLGVRTTSQNFNLPSQTGLSNEELSNISTTNAFNINNGVPNVENTTTYFGYFDSLQANYPIFRGTTSPVLKYLIREDGEIFSPSSDDATYYNIVDSFPRGTKAYSTFLYDKTTIFTATQSIRLSGESYSPILYNIATSSPISASWTSSLEFDSIDGGSFIGGNPPNFNVFLTGKGRSSTPYNINTTYNAFAFNQIVSYDSSSGWNSFAGFNPYSPYYEFNQLPQTPIAIEANIWLQLNSVQTSTTFRIKILSSKDNGITWQTLADNFDGPINTSNKFQNDVRNFLNVSSQLTNGNKKAIFWFCYIWNYYPSLNERLIVTVENLGPSIDMYDFDGSLFPIYSSNKNKLKINTYNAIDPVIGLPFWTTGSINGTSITSSVGLGNFILGNYKQKNIIGSGFDAIELPCDIQIGDEIRFEYDEANTYRIISIDPGSSPGGSAIYKFGLDKIIPNSPSLDINHFTVRRLVKDSITGITVNGDPASSLTNGFILPEYPSRDLKNNLSKIINDLTDRSLL